MLADYLRQRVELFLPRGSVAWPNVRLHVILADLRIKDGRYFLRVICASVRVLRLLMRDGSYVDSHSMARVKPKTAPV